MIAHFFEELSAFLNTHIAPISNELDQDVSLLKNAFDKLTDMGGLKLLIPKTAGGLDGGRDEWIKYNIQLSQYSGALLFLQAQHQYVIFRFKKLLPNQRIQKILELSVAQKKSFGIAFAAGRKILTAKHVENGYLISGKLLWVTGYGYFSFIALTFDYEGKNFYTILPFATDEKSILISSPIQLAVYNSTQTVSITLNDYFVTDDNILASEETPTHSKPIEHPTVYNFAGVSQALLAIAMKGKYRDQPDVKNMHEKLQNEWNSYYAKIEKNDCCPLQLRTKGLLLADHCLNFARMACGAEGLLASHPINRIAREISQYMIAGYSDIQVHAYMENFFNY